MDLLFALTFATQVVDENGATSWPEATVAATAILTGVAMITAIAVVALWQGLGVWRARIAISRELAYQQLSQKVAANQEDTLNELRKAAAELAELRARTAELERLLKEVE